MIHLIASHRSAYLFLTFFILLCFSCKEQKKETPQSEYQPHVPDIRDVLMYEVFVRNFTPEGTFNAMIPHLDRLKALGVNTLWLMPIQPTGVENKKGTYGSPYAIQDYTAVHPDYGTKADFKRLVDSIHAKGMYIIIDEVANHTAWDHAWMKDHPDWYTYDSTGKKIVPPVADWTDVADLNFDSPDLHNSTIAAMKYWVDSFNIDGYRCDVAEMIPTDFWETCIIELRKSRPVMMLAEGAKPDLYEAGFDMSYGWEMYNAVKGVWSGASPASFIDSVLQKEKKEYPAEYQPIRFITNHDENSWDDVPEKKFGNTEGAKAAFVTMITLPGVPFIYNGQEVAYPTRINLFEKYTIDWTANSELQEWYKAILNYHNQSDILKKGTIDQFSHENEKVLIYQRKELGKDPLWIIVNCRNEEVIALLPKALQKKKLVDQISLEGIASEETMKLRPYEYHILKAE